MSETIRDEVRTEILNRLTAAEQQHGVRVLYACESGSRAWGFSSPDSDYDVRFIYARSPDWYLTFDVERRRDVIEYPIVDEMDCGGWDLRKALHLFTRTNGALLEWLNSPIQYLEVGDTAERLRQLAPQCINSVALCYHYSHMARGNAREYVFQEQVKLKKYFYVLRPLLAIRYLEAGNGIPPVLFQELVDSVAPTELKPVIADLVERKRSIDEIGLIPAVPEVEAFIKAELDRHGQQFSGPDRPDIQSKKSVREQLNAIFKAAIGAA